MTHPTEDTPTHVHISKVGENMCLECGERLPTTQDDRTSAKNARVVDTQLRKQIYTFFLDGIKEVPANPSARTDALLALFQKEQLQLVSELIGQKDLTWKLDDGTEREYVSVAVLEHKKQELEGKI